MAHPSQRAVAAAARAAAKRAEKAQRPATTPAPAATAVLTRPEPPATPEPTGTPAAPRPRRRLLFRPLLAVLLLASLAAAAMLGQEYRDGQRTGQARRDALTAAVAAAPVLLSYDYRHLDQDFAAARNRLTGPFRDTYTKTTTTVVKPTAAKYHGVVKATVATPAAVVSATPDRVVVLLFVNQVTTSTRVTTPRLDLNRVRMTLTRTPAGWKVSAIDAL